MIRLPTSSTLFPYTTLFRSSLRIDAAPHLAGLRFGQWVLAAVFLAAAVYLYLTRSEEHTSELQSQFHLVCRLLLEKKNCQTRNCLFSCIQLLEAISWLFIIS